MRHQGCIYLDSLTHILIILYIFPMQLGSYEHLHGKIHCGVRLPITLLPVTALGDTWKTDKGIPFSVEDMVSQPLGPMAMPSFILHYFDFRIDHYRFLALYHHHLRICHKYTSFEPYPITSFVPADVYSQHFPSLL